MKEELLFKNRAEFRNWLEKNDLESEGIWIIFNKKKEGKSLSAQDALEEALCFGWIDGLIKRIDETKYKKYFSPRREGSKWSGKNKATVERMIEAKKMTVAGLSIIQRAKEEGLWEIQDNNSISDDEYEVFIERIKWNKKALDNYINMPQSVKKQFVLLYNEPKKEETRERRLKELVGLLELGLRPMEKYRKS